MTEGLRVSAILLPVIALFVSRLLKKPLTVAKFKVVPLLVMPRMAFQALLTARKYALRSCSLPGQEWVPVNLLAT